MLSISSKKTARFLAFVVLGLVLASVLGHLSRFLGVGAADTARWLRLFDVDGEKNIPSLYSAAALLFSSGLLALIARLKQIKRDRYTWYWGILSLLFGLMAVDEWTSLHEKITKPLRSLLNTDSTFYFAWVIPGLIIVAIVGLAYWKFLKALPAKIQRLFCLSASVYITGALGLEMIGGAYVAQFKTLIWNAEGWKQTPQALVYMMMMTVEETLEMVGIILFIYTLLCYLGSYFQEIRIQIDAETDFIRSQPYEAPDKPALDSSQI